MAIQDTDKLLVNRSGTNYTTEVQNLMAIQDTDSLLVVRGTANYKVTGAELKNYTKYSEASFASYCVSSSTGYNLVNVGSPSNIYPTISSPSSLSMSYGLGGFFFGVDETGNIVIISAGSKTTLSFTGGPPSPIKKFTIRLNNSSNLYERFVLYENGELYKNESINYNDTTGSLVLVTTNVANINSIYSQNIIWTKTDGTVQYLGQTQLSTSPFGTQTANTVGTIPVTLPSGRFATTLIPIANGPSNNPSDGSLAVLLDDGTIYRWGNFGGTLASPELYSPLGVSFRSISGTSYGLQGGGIIAISTTNQIYGFNNTRWAYLFTNTSSSAPLSLAGGVLGGNAYNAVFVGQGGGAGQTVTAVIMIQGTDGKLYCATNKSGNVQIVNLQTSLPTNTLDQNLFGFIGECSTLSISEVPGSGSGEWYGFTEWLFY